MSDSIQLAVVILNFRTPDVTIDCLKTLAAEYARWPRFRVVLVDNASGDDSVPRIGEAIRANDWTGWLDFRPFPKNLGFAGGNNVILREWLADPACAPYLLLLNSDTLVHPGCLEKSVAALEAEPGVGALSCQLLNRDGTVQNVCRRFPRPDRETVRAFGLPWVFPGRFQWADLEDAGWDRRAGPRDVEWISGAFFLARPEALRQAGVLDEDFFFYGEDCEWCHRIFRAGYRIRFDPSGEIVHLGGASSDSTRVRNRTRDIYTWKARFLTQRKCYGRLAEWWVRGCYIVVFAARTLWLTLRGQAGTPKHAEMREGLSQLTGRLEP